MRYSALGLVWAIIGLLVSSVSATAQYANVDDPSTPERHRLMIDFIYISGQTPGSEFQCIPYMFIRYGIRNNLEVNVGAGVLSTRNSGSKRMFGQDDVYLGTKWRWLEETASRPQVAFCFNTKFPTASRSRGMGTGEFDHSAWMTVAKSFGRYQAYGNIGGNLLGDGGSGMKDNWFYGVGLGYQLTETFMLGGELYGNSRDSVGGRDDVSWGLGFYYSFQPDRALTFQVGRSMHGNSDLSVYAALSFNLK